MSGGQTRNVRALARRIIHRVAARAGLALQHHTAEQARAMEDLQHQIDQQGRAVEALAADVGELKRQLELTIQRLPPEQRPARVVGHTLDSPPSDAELPRQPVVIDGWVITDPPAARLEVTVDQAPLGGKARLGLPRPDVAEVWEHPDAPTSGYAYALDLAAADAAEPSVTVELVAVTMDGSRLRLTERTFRLAEPTAGTLPAIEERLASTGSPVEVEPVRGGQPLRLLVHAHHLGVGGAQNRLHDLLKHLALSPDVHCEVIGPARGPSAERIEELGIPVHTFDGLAVGSLERYETKQALLADAIRTAAPHVVWANTLVSFPVVDAAHRLGVPCVWSIHESTPIPQFALFGYPWDAPMHPDVQTRLRDAFKWAAAVVFLGESARDVYLPDGADNAAVLRAMLDVEPLVDRISQVDRGAIRRSRGLDGRRVVLCPGVITPRKAQARLITAVREIVPRWPDVLCVVVGDQPGSYSESLHLAVARSGLEGHLRIEPATADIHEWYAGADLVVVPSDDEIMPGVSLEAAAAGIPLVITDVPGVSEVFEDGRSAFVCEPSDAAALAARLEDALGTPNEVLAAMAAHARRATSALVPPADRLPLLERLIRETAADPRSPPVRALRAIDEASGVA